MTNIIRNTAIVAGILAIIAYAIYRYIKKGISKPISYEDILHKAVSRVKESDNKNDKYTLCILPPTKAKVFISENPDFFDKISLHDIKDKQLVIWYLQGPNEVVYQEALISDSLTQDFMDAVPLDKIYQKTIKLKHE